MNIRILILATFLSLAAASLLHGQESVDLNNLSSINIDELSDAQIQSFLKKVENSGYSQDQLQLLAKAKGMSASQMNKLERRIKALQSSDGNKIENNLNRVDLLRNQLSNSFSASAADPFLSIVSRDSLIGSGNDFGVFGRRYFTGEIPIFQPSLNGPTPENYTLGPGDELIIDVWGAFEYSYQLIVSPEGYIRIPDVGPVQVAGLQFNKASQKIENRLRKIYSSLGDNAFVDISLGGIKSINVHVVGEVSKPGTYTTHSFSTALNLLYLAGGPTLEGSLREIEIYRNGQRLSTIDGYKFLLHGEDQTQRLADGDVVLVKPYLYHVEIRGEVKRPSIYELREGESLIELIDFAGGFTGEAYRRVISLRRISNGFKSVSTIKEEHFGDFPLQDADQLEIKKVSNFYTNRVAIQGAIFQPGEFELTDSLSLYKLIDLAGGLRGDALYGRAVIYRRNSDYTLASTSINLEGIAENSWVDDVNLQNEDLVIIESVNEIKERPFVQIEGEVIRPGKYPFVEGQTIEELILLAGGMKETALKSKAEVARRLIDSKKSDEKGAISKLFEIEINSNLAFDSSASTFSLLPFDFISIRKNPFYKKQSKIELSGEIIYPGVYVLREKGERISDLVGRAGGLTDFAFVNGATLVRNSEYFTNQDDDSGEQQTAKVKRDELLTIFKRDTITSKDEIALRKREIVGIELDKILASPGSEYDLILKEGDILNIPTQLQTVRIRGEVLHPGNVRFGQNFSFKEFISQAGGFKDEARVKKSYVIFANGTAERTKSFLWIKIYPKIQPGSEVIIPTRRERRKLSPQEVLGMTTGIASLALIFTRF